MDVRWSEVTIDCADPVAMAGFWQGLLGGTVGEPLPGWRRVTIPGRPSITLQPVPEPKTGKARLHLDLVVDDLSAAMAHVRSLGGASTGERHEYDEGTVVVMTDLEGTEFCMVEYAPGHEET